MAPYAIGARQAAILDVSELIPTLTLLEDRHANKAATLYGCR